MWLEQIARPAMGDKDPTHILDEDTLGLTEEPVALFRLTHHGASLGHQTIEGLVVPRMPPTRPPRAQQVGRVEEIHAVRHGNPAAIASVGH